MYTSIISLTRIYCVKCFFAMTSTLHGVYANVDGICRDIFMIKVSLLIECLTINIKHTHEMLL